MHACRDSLYGTWNGRLDHCCRRPESPSTESVASSCPPSKNTVGSFSSDWFEICLASEETWQTTHSFSCRGRDKAEANLYLILDTKRQNLLQKWPKTGYKDKLGQKLRRFWEIRRENTPLKANVANQFNVQCTKVRYHSIVQHRHSYRTSRKERKSANLSNPTPNSIALDLLVSIVGNESLLSHLPEDRLGEVEEAAGHLKATHKNFWLNNSSVFKLQYVLKQSEIVISLSNNHKRSTKGEITDFWPIAICYLLLTPSKHWKYCSKSHN